MKEKPEQLQEFIDTHKTKEKSKEKEESVFMTLSKFPIPKT